MNFRRPTTGIGKVYLVGAGPGDPGLLTVRGRACLEAADVVLYDALANGQLLHWAPQAEWICVGKHGQIPHWTQSDINSRLVELAQQGRRVVRLKGGDPAIFARTAEELEVLAEAGIAFEVVPGITAALAAASYVGIPLTHRQHASAVAFLTGQQQAGGVPQHIDWQAVAHFPGTLVFYMGVTTADAWTGQLLAAGKSPQTPAAIIRRCSWSDQSVIRCTLGEVAAALAPPQPADSSPSHTPPQSATPPPATPRMRPPVIVVIGEVANLGSDFDWFTTRPLHGCGVMVTRSGPQAAELAAELTELGADVYQQPALEIGPPSDFSSLDAAIARIRDQGVQGLTFSSSNGVDGFFQRLEFHDLDSRVLAGTCVVAVGPATAQRLRTFGVRADVVPETENEFSAQGILATLPAALDKQQWVVTGNNHSRDTLPEGLRRRGAIVSQAVCYTTHAVTSLSPEVLAALQAHRIHYVSITSSQVARSCHALLADYVGQLQPISLSGTISHTLAELGWPAAGQARQNTMSDLIAAIVDAHAKHA